MKMTAGDGCNVLIGYEDGSVALWDCRQYKRPLLRLKIHPDPVMCINYETVTGTGFSGSAGEEICSWTTNKDILTLKDTVTVTNPGFNDCCVRKDGKLVVFAGWDGHVRLFSVKKMKPLAVLAYHKDSVYCATFSDDKLLACGSKDEQISLWDVYR